MNYIFYNCVKCQINLNSLELNAIAGEEAHLRELRDQITSKLRKALKCVPDFVDYMQRQRIKPFRADLDWEQFKLRI